MEVFKLAAVIADNRNGIDIESVIDRHLKYLPKDTIAFHCSGFNGGINEYNNLLKSAKFWEQYFDYDRVLIFQSDSYLLRTGIEAFYEFDYVGAPWKWTDKYAGNGGLSLRNPKIMHKICTLIPCNNLNEDHFFVDAMYKNNIGILAPIYVANLFSCEAIFQLGTVGCHAIEKYLTFDECNLIMNQYVRRKI